jgi:hypothetical protein
MKGTWLVGVFTSHPPASGKRQPKERQDGFRTPKEVGGGGRAVRVSQKRGAGGEARASVEPGRAAQWGAR